MSLLEVRTGTEYSIKSITTGDDELNSFLFTLGCYEGEPIKVISRRKSGLIISIKGSRYSIDNALGAAISVE